MAEIQKRLCPACGQANDYSTAVCSFCATPLFEAEEAQGQGSLASTVLEEPAETSPERSSFGITSKELQAIAAQERSTSATPAHDKKEIRIVLIVLAIVPLLILILLGLFGGLAKLSDIWRMGG
jgi:uncharacterized OB-fold protein